MHWATQVYISKAQKKNWILVCPLGKQLSNLLAKGLFLLVVVNDLVKGWIAWTFAGVQVIFKSYLPSKKHHKPWTTGQDFFRALIWSPLLGFICGLILSLV